MTEIKERIAVVETLISELKERFERKDARDIWRWRSAAGAMFGIAVALARRELGL